MSWLLGVNALLALGFEGHIFHERAEAWVCGLETGATPALATCAITELGFVRILPQLTAFEVDVASARNLLGKLKDDPRLQFLFLTDDHGADRLPDWVKSFRQTTDGHLLALAQARGCQLATLDTGIPGSFQIPN